MSAKPIVIIGGGPAGAFVATELARAGRDVFVFDEKLAWEKPCGGGLTQKALASWPFLSEALVERNWITHCELIAPSGRKVRFELGRPIAIFSRRTLNGLMLRRAGEAGARLIRERVVDIEGGEGNWVVKTLVGRYEAEFIVLAGGARSSFRSRFAAPLKPEDSMVALGYYIPGTHQTVQVKFLPGLHGYMWVFPRNDHFSVGICGRMAGASSRDLRRLLEDSLPHLGLSLNGASFYAHVLPALTTGSLRKSEFCGDGWAIIGDAAGFVDAITGEGLYYALRSAELLARSFLRGAPEAYAAQVKSEILPQLEIASRIAERFYSGDWLGAPVIERMVNLSARSPRFRELMRDLFAGTQEYSTLKRRAHRGLPLIAAEALMSMFRARLSVIGKNANKASVRRTGRSLVCWSRQDNLTD